MRSSCTTNWWVSFKNYANTAVSVPFSLAHPRPYPHLLHPCWIPQVWATTLIVPPCQQKQTAPSVSKMQAVCTSEMCVPLLETTHCVALSCVQNCSVVCTVIAGGYRKQKGQWIHMNLHMIDYLSKICFTYIFKPPLCTTQFAKPSGWYYYYYICTVHVIRSLNCQHQHMHNFNATG